MDELAIANVVQTALSLHRVKVQAKLVDNHLYILASRDQTEVISYDLLFSLVSTSLDGLEIADVQGFTLYGKIAGQTEPEWKRSGTMRSPRIKPKPKSVPRYIPFVVLVGVLVLVGLGWLRSQQELRKQAQSYYLAPFNPNLPMPIAQLESDRDQIKSILGRLTPWGDNGELVMLQTRLGVVETKLALEEQAKQQLNRAAAPSGQKKWQEAIKILQQVPPNTEAGRIAQDRLKVYNKNLQALNRQRQKQMLDKAIQNILKTPTGEGVRLEMSDLRATGVSKAEFMNVCTPFVEFNVNPQPPSLAAALCNYLWN